MKMGVPELNIGMVGHVDHGKTTLLERLSGKWADTHSEEIKRGITIRLGYADTTFYQYEDGTFGTEKKPNAKELRTVSFVDAPGHESLMATMLAGATIMDGAFLLIAANEECPQPQTREHIMALEIIGLKHLIVVQNKIDLVDEKSTIRNYQQIKEFLKGTSFENAPVVPVSAMYKIGISELIGTVQETIKTPKRDASETTLMLTARSFDINKPGTLPEAINGGVLGGALIQGVLSVGDDIEIRPGIQVTEKNQTVYKPLTTKIAGLHAGGKNVEKVSPGGSIAVLTSLDPSIVKSDSLAGSVVGLSGKMPPVWQNLSLEPHLLQRMVSVQGDLSVDPIKVSEPLMLNVNAAATVGMVKELGTKKITCELKRPVVADKGNRITISRSIGQRWRLIGWGLILEK